MGISPDHPAIQDAIRKGLIPELLPPPTKPAKGNRGRKHKPTVEPLFLPPGTFLIAHEVVSEANERFWQARSKRTVEARQAVSRATCRHLRELADLSDHYHNGGQLIVVFTRLGGKRLDRTNLPSSFKGIEDAFAMVLGCNDGDPRWQPKYEQDTKALKVGVQVEFEKQP